MRRRNLNVDMPGGDFDGCRFDFRIDSKKGLMPAARRPARHAVREGGSACSTLYSCKHCGVLCATRAALVEHKRVHRSSTSQQHHQPHVSPPEATSSQSSSRAPHPSPLSTISSNDVPSPHEEIESQTSTLTSSVASPLTSCAIVLYGSHQSSCADRRDVEPQSVIQRYISGLNQQQQQQHQGNGDEKITSVSAKLGDVIASSDILKSSANSSSSSASTTTKQFKCRQLNAMVERLWKEKLKTMPEVGASPKSGTTPSPNERVDAIGDQQLFVRRVTAAPGSQPQFYTSLMRLQSTRRRDVQQNRSIFKTKKNSSGKGAIQSKDDRRINSQDIDKKQVTLTPEAASAAVEESATTVAELASIVPPVLVSLDNGASSNCQYYVCDFNGCKRTFRELKHLKVHRMQHTNERPLACDICNYSCRQRNSLNWHMKSRHGLEKSVTPDGKTMYG